MKKLALALLIILTSLGAASAQTDSKTKVKADPRDLKIKQEGTAAGKGRKDRTPEERADMQAAKISKQLTLTPDQTARIREISLIKAQRMDEVKARQKDSRQAAGTEMKEIKSNFETELKGILTPDQFAQYEKAREEKKEGHKKHRGGHQKGEYKQKTTTK